MIVHEDDDFIQLAFEFAQRNKLGTEQAKKIYTLVKQAYQQHLDKLHEDFLANKESEPHFSLRPSAGVPYEDDI